MSITRGDIYFITMPSQNTKAKHSCEKGRRPGVVVSSNIGNKTGRVILCCPITTKIKELSCNVNIAWSADSRPSQVLCNHITAIPIEMLTKRCGGLTEEEMWAVNAALLKSLGIRVNYEEVKE